MEVRPSVPARLLDIAVSAAARAPFTPFLIRRRRVIQASADAAAWALALWLAAWMRFEFDMTAVPVAGLLGAVPVAASAQVFTGVVTGLYLGRWRFGSFDEAAALVRATVGTALVYAAVDAFALPGRPVPRSVVAVGTVLAFVFMGTSRYLWRALLDHRRRPRSADVERIVVFGAGEAGYQILTSMLRDPNSSYVPVALLDDHPAKRGLKILGISVQGGRDALEDVARRFQATTVLVAIPSAGADLIRDVSQRAESLGLGVKVLPPVGELFGSVGVADIRQPTEGDLLGRHRIETDIASIAGYLTGKRVLVTGAGGSIGSELCRQIHRFAPAELFMLDRDESSLHTLQLSIEGKALLDTPNLILCDIRDPEALTAAFEEAAPDVVFHAAALKHVTFLERYPDEAYKTNVVGTMNVLDAAKAVGVDRFVNISTDKAADPISVLGYTKRIAERLTAATAEEADGTYLSVRFGNVLGSRGSVLTAFRAQIESGGPVTVTDPEVTRYFMTVEEAVELVIQAGAIGGDGEALVLDMGAPVRIADVATQLVASAPHPVAITFTGLRPGEKLHETLFGAGEPDHRPIHPLISHVRVESLRRRSLKAVAASGAGVQQPELAQLCEYDTGTAAR